MFALMIALSANETTPVCMLAVVSRMSSDVGGCSPTLRQCQQKQRSVRVDTEL